MASMNMSSQDAHGCASCEDMFIEFLKGGQ